MARGGSSFLRWLGAISILIALSAVFWLRHESPHQPAAREVSAVGPASQRQASAPKTAVPDHASRFSARAMPTRSVSQQSQEASLAAPNPEGTVIEFRVVDGFAVAYGDLLLGKPEPGVQVERGHYEAPVPQLWERAEIPYAISPMLPDPQRVEKALSYLQQNTPVVFVPYQGQKDAIVFEPGEEHCYSYLGRVGGLQPIRLSPRCGWTEILHETMHALGFVHEQSRRDRDQYLEILWGNISEEFRPQYAQVPEAFLEPIRDTPFDYRSIMMYRPDAFAAKPGLPTMKSRTEQTIAPVAEGLSEGDIQRLRRMYDLRYRR